MVPHSNELDLGLHVDGAGGALINDSEAAHIDAFEAPLVAGQVHAAPVGVAFVDALGALWMHWHWFCWVYVRLSCSHATQNLASLGAATSVVPTSRPADFPPLKRTPSAPQRCCTRSRKTYPPTTLTGSSTPPQPTRCVVHTAVVFVGFWCMYETRKHVHILAGALAGRLECHCCRAAPAHHKAGLGGRHQDGPSW